MIWSPQDSILKNPQHTLTYISKAEITVIRKAKWFLFKKITNRSGHFNLEKISPGEQDKDLIKSQIIMEMHKMKAPFIIFHYTRMRRYQKEEKGQLLLWDILPQVTGQEKAAIPISTDPSNTTGDSFTNAHYIGWFRWTSSSEKSLNHWLLKRGNAVFLVLFP